MYTFLLVVLCLYIFMRIMSRWIAPWLLRRYMQKMQERMNPGAAQQKTRKKGTTVNIPRKQKSTRTRTYTSAENVDFEEIEDND
ncbi:MAG: hypothetical protein CVU11_09310 [Bacteroidetes bacterium HGW-Bacteroidetes-6]|nr:MAG: hypothetical protein CVU11_09310 [Bacteroidetes bacterium HGW-Bacteroidetes-6]